MTQGENMLALVPGLVEMASDPAVSIPDLLGCALCRRLPSRLARPSNAVNV
jgi:hypothetical protein